LSEGKLPICIVCGKPIARKQHRDEYYNPYAITRHMRFDIDGKKVYVHYACGRKYLELMLRQNLIPKM
jgi:hypothetical protein